MNEAVRATGAAANRRRRGMPVPPVPVLLVTWSYSNCPFALALPTERTEAILHGLVEAFAFFGFVPRELWWDNPTTVAVHLFRGRQRTLHPRYAALASHYTFAPKFCLPARGNDSVEDFNGWPQGPLFRWRFRRPGDQGRALARLAGNGRVRKRWPYTLLND
jgi:hypothetical protein